MRGLFVSLLLAYLTHTAELLDPDNTGSFDLILQANLELQTGNSSSPPLPNNVFEGDIALTDEQRRNIDIFGNVLGRAVDRNKNIRWPEGVIPYEIDCSLQKMPNAKDAIKKAMKEWESKTCIRFAPRTNQKDYLWFFRERGCWSNVGRIGSKTFLSVGYGCEFQHVMVHEIGHAVGFWHEQSRPDRDSYVQIIKENILPGLESAFEKYSRDKIDSLSLPYDYGSIMHYPFNAFSRNGQPTLRALRPLNGKKPYKQLSNLDAKQANIMYNYCRKLAPEPLKRDKREAVERDEFKLRTKRAVCRDYNVYCKIRARRRQCLTNRVYMSRYCRASCGWCRTTATTTCRDYNNYCRYWAGRGQCRRNPRYMLVYCRKSCRVCTTRPRPRPPTRRPRPPTRRPRPPTRRPRPPTRRPRPPTRRPRPPTRRPRPPTRRPRPPTRRPRPPTQKPPIGHKCGVRYYGRAPGRIVDGQTATKNSWPWQAQLRSRYGSHFCGGSLVASQWVLTAAHCVRGSSINRSYRVRLGEHHLRRSDGTEQEFTVSRIIVHPGYRRKTADHDIALLKLNRPARLNDAVNLICLPSQGVSVPDGTNCYITGWGRTGYNRPGAHVLQEAMMPTVNQKTCANAMRRWGRVTRRMICSGFGGSSTVSGCFGDSGGPLVCEGKNNRWILQGAVSWGTRTCSAGRNQYTVYARVSEFVSWIRKYIGNTPTVPPQPPTPDVTPPPPDTPPTLKPVVTPPPPETPPPITPPKTSEPPTPPIPPTPPLPPTPPKPTKCPSPKPLGMENKEIPDSALSASSQYNRWHSAREARLNLKPGVTGVGAWCPSVVGTKEYLEIDLGVETVVTHVATQGRESKYPKFIKSYAVLYSDDGNAWMTYPTNFTGNIDMTTVTKNSINPPIIARYIRINPRTWKGAICMRAELYGCKVKPTTKPPTDPPTTQPRSSTQRTPPQPPTPPLPTTLPPVTSTIPPNPIGIRCVDKHPSCPSWASSGRCTTDHYVKQNCLKSCKSKQCDNIPVRPAAPCSNPLGLGWDNQLPDTAFTSSSDLNLGTWDAGARNARLYKIDDFTNKRVGAWCAAARENQWLQVDLGKSKYVTAVATQGRDLYFEHVKTYQLAYSVDGTTWKYIQTKSGQTVTFNGNCDHFTPVVNRLPRGVTARYIKFFPMKSNFPCMRVEVYGCD